MYRQEPGRATHRPLARNRCRGLAGSRSERRAAASQHPEPRRALISGAVQQADDRKDSDERVHRHPHPGGPA
jgi:hypothetical protein